MKYITYEELQKHIITEGCDDGCGYIDERDIVNMDWQEDKSEVVTLNKIRAEIKSISPKTYPFLHSTDRYVKEDAVLQIIEKYREVGE